MTETNVLAIPRGQDQRVRADRSISVSSIWNLQESVANSSQYPVRDRYTFDQQKPTALSSSSSKSIECFHLIVSDR